MARIRSVKPEVWNDPEFVSCSPLARLLWLGSWNHADDYGVLKDEPVRLKLQVLPADDCDPHALVDELVERELLLRRVAPDGTRVLVVRTFCVHQKIDKRADGRWGHPDTFTVPADTHPSPPDPNLSPPIPTSPPESQPVPTIRKEGKGKEGKEENVTSEPEARALTLVADTATPSASEPQELHPPATEVAAQRFEEHFWPSYPRRHGKRVGKPKALAQWKKLTVDQQREALRGAKNYAAHCERTGSWPKDADRWLRDRLWEDWQEPAKSTHAANHRDSEDAWLERYGAQTMTMDELRAGLPPQEGSELGIVGAGTRSA